MAVKATDHGATSVSKYSRVGFWTALAAGNAGGGGGSGGRRKPRDAARRGPAGAARDGADPDAFEPHAAACDAGFHAERGGRSGRREGPPGYGAGRSGH